MLSSVWAKTVFDKRRAMIGWILGTVAFATLNIVFYPSIRDQQEDLLAVFETIPESMLAMFGVDSYAELLMPDGYLMSQIYALTVPLLMIIFTVGMGAAATAGEESDGTADLLLSLPIRRERIVLEKFWAMTLLTSAIAVALFALLLIFNDPLGFDLPIVGLLAINVIMVLLALLFGALALFVGALSGSKGITIGVAAGAAVGFYFLFGFAPLVEVLEPLEVLSPFEWALAENALSAGFIWDRIGLLALVTAILLGLSVWAFRNRDLVA